jgi:Zinc carboxypeptidase
MNRSLAAAAALLCWLVAGHSAAAPSFTTEAEKSGFKRTGRYDEVVRLCNDFQAANPGKVKCVTFGTTPEGRPMVALVVSTDGAFTADDMRARNRGAILIQGGIHAGEIEGKDAIFIALRELLSGKLAPGILGKVTIVFVPIFNVDGAERFGAHNRPNQRGPEEMGFRANAQNLNLNRDYVKAETPEMHAMLGLLESWDPLVYVDLHTTDGAKFQPDVSILVGPEEPQAGLERAAAALSAAFMQRLTAMQHMPLAFYPDFRAHDDPTSGFATNQAPPRFSQEYAAARNRLGVLVETHSWKTYAQRVVATHDTLQVLFEQALTQADGWRAAETAADQAATKLGGTDVALVHLAGPTARTIDFPAYAYTVKPSEVSGKSWIVYDETRPQVWHVPLYDQLVPSLTVHAPRAGYLISAAHASWVEPLLRAHGIHYQVVPRALAGRPVQGFHVAEVTYSPPFEGRTEAKIKGEWRATRQSFPAGSLFVPIAQPLALLVLHLLEPEAPDSLVAWGFWNAMFEQKEYMEDYVLEGEARRMLAADPKLKAEFDKRVREDAEFAKSPEKRLRFFYLRHPAWDERIGWVPVFRADEMP